jgi:hypothetical protein
MFNPKAIPEATYWWQMMPALPEDGSQEYYALKRLWADHTMNTARRGRGFYWWGTEDNMTAVLFQNWAVIEDPEAFAPLLAACGHRTRGLKEVRWAYACEEQIRVGEFVGVDGRFLIPDIVLRFEDEIGTGLVAFEVKRPGVVPTEKDAAKLRAYTRLNSMRGIERKTGCFLVGSREAEAARTLSQGPVATWEALLSLQLEAFEREFRSGAAWLRRIYALQGISTGATRPPAADDEVCAAIVSTDLTAGQRRFLLGAETVEAFLAGRASSPPLDWLADEPCRLEHSEKRLQSTASRRVCRWDAAWNVRREV